MSINWGHCPQRAVSPHDGSDGAGWPYDDGANGDPTVHRRLAALADGKPALPILLHDFGNSFSLLA